MTARIMFPPVRWRWLNRIYAHINSYFWLPCPICNEKFGGHEWLPGHSILKETEGRVVCYKEECRLEAESRSTFKVNPVVTR